MDERARKLTSPADCLRLEKNAIERGEHALAQDARRRALDLKAEQYGARSDVERECLAAVYAYERILTDKNGKTTRANRTWPMIKKHGVLSAVDQLVCKPNETVGFTELVERGLQNYAFEAVILRHPTHFSEAAIARSRERMSKWTS